MPRAPSRSTSTCSIEYSYNLFVTARRQPSNTRAGNINTDRRGARLELVHQPHRRDDDHVRAAGARRRTPTRRRRRRNGCSLREKSAGTNPGFTARTPTVETWFLQFDQPAYPRRRQRRDVEIATKLFWALGYNQVETFITTFDPARVGDRSEGDDQAAVRREDAVHARRHQPGARARRRATPTAPTGRRPARLLPGTILGPFRYAGTRSDDPNDLVPHEHRRELRALRVFGAWTNLVDLKAGNTLDALVDEDGRAIVKHYLQDVGSTFGMANNPHEWDMGWEYFYDAGRRDVADY